MKKPRRGKGGRPKAKPVKMDAHKPAASLQLSLQDQLRNVTMHVTARRYRDAIAAYKRLLQIEDRAAWREGLVLAYLGRVKQLAEKGMFKEAAVMWENMAGQTPSPSQVELYLRCLLRAGSLQRAAKEYVERACSEPSITTLMAAYVLVNPKMQEALPEDAPLCRYIPQAMAAIDAYCEGRDEALVEIVKQFPFRSPFRDLRWILQALISKDPASAQILLDKVAKDSPFYCFSKMADLRLSPTATVLTKLPAMQPPFREATLAMFGFAAQQKKPIQALLQLSPTKAKMCFDFVLTQKKVFGVDQVRAYCFTLLPYYRKGVARFEQSFGALSPFDKARINALALLRQGEPESVADAWMECVHSLTTTTGLAAKSMLPIAPQQANKAASIISLWLADHAITELDPEAYDIGGYLEAAVEQDSSSKTAWLRYLEHLKSYGENKIYARVLEDAVKQFSEDVDILAFAAKAAFDRGAYKKAAGYAECLLAYNAIDKEARKLLIACHLAHAKKQLSTRKYKLAERELGYAEQACRETVSRVSVLQHQGLLKLLEKKTAQSQKLLVAAHSLGGAGVSADFHLYMTGLAMGIASPTVLVCQKAIVKQLRAGVRRKPDKKEILALMSVSDHYLAEKESKKNVAQVFTQLQQALFAAVSLEYSKAEMDLMLAALHRANALKILAKFTSKARKCWDNSPLYFFYSIFSRALGDVNKVNRGEHATLRRAYGEAQEDGDERVVKLISDFLGLSGSFLGGLFGGMIPFGTLFDDDDDDDFPVDRW